MSMYEPYLARIIELVEKGLNLKEVHTELEKQGIYGTYQGFYWYCKRHSIVARAKKICVNCRHCREYTGKVTGNKLRFCRLNDERITADTIPRWCRWFERK